MSEQIFEELQNDDGLEIASIFIDSTQSSETNPFAEASASQPVEDAVPPASEPMQPYAHSPALYGNSTTHPRLETSTAAYDCGRPGGHYDSRGKPSPGSSGGEGDADSAGRHPISF